MKQLWLGVGLIAAASAVLLISDLGQRRQSTSNLPRVAILQHASQAIVDEGVQGMIAALAEGGYKDGETVAITRFNAENDVATANSIAQELVSGRFDLVLTATTLSLQAVSRANQDGRVNQVFGLVTDPAGTGVGIGRDDPLDHPSYMAGIGTMQPVRQAFELARECYPALKTIGVAWNPAESNSEANVVIGRQAAKDMGIELLEATVENSSGVFEAVSSLVSRGVDAIWIGGDVTVIVGLDSALAAAERGRIPVFTNTPGNSEKGALFDLGANYFEVGRETGRIAVQILNGTDPATIPVLNIVPEALPVNTTALEGLKDPWQIPLDVLSRASSITDETGTHLQGDDTGSPLAKTWNLQLVELNNTIDVEDTERGILDGLEEEGLVDGRDYTTNIRNAQGDMATLNGLVDAAIADGADLLITMSTPTLQAALQRAQGRTPVVFGYVANAVAAGAGTSNDDHLPNVTGVTVGGAYPEMIQLVQRIMPNARRIGTLYVPAEVNMVYNLGILNDIAEKAGIEVVSVGVSNSGEVADAALALAGRGIDAIVQIGGNATAAAFSGIVQAANRAKLPIFGFQTTHAKGGAAVTLSRDYYDAGVEVGKLAVRVMRGADPSTIPFAPYGGTKLIVNPKAAEAVGLKIPADVMSEAEQFIGE